MAEVGAQKVAMNNQVTTLQCNQQCRNPSTLLSADEVNLKYVTNSNCSTATYSHSVKLIKSPKQPTPADKGCESEGNPCSAVSGQKFESQVDYNSPGLTFIRYYNSFAIERNYEWMGLNWRNNYDYRVFYSGVASLAYPLAIVERPTGQSLRFQFINGGWVGDPDVQERLYSLAGGGYQIIAANDDTETYDSAGRLQSITDRAGSITVLTYDTQNRMSAVTAPDGRQLTFTYSTDGERIKTMTDPAGNVYTYNYTSEKLTSVVLPHAPGTVTRSYQYGSTGFPNALTRITDEAGVSFASWTYDTQGRVKSSQHAGGVERVDLVFGPNGTTTVTDAAGAVRTYGTTVQHGVDKLTSISGQRCGYCGDKPSAVTYDANGYENLVTDFNGNVTDYDYDGRGLELQRIEGKGSPLARTTVTVWHTTLHVPMQVDVYQGEGTTGLHLRRTSYTYTQGRVTSMTVVDPQTSATRTTTYVYYGDDVGDNPILTPLLKRVDGPRALPVKDVTEYFYATTDSAVHKKRDLIEVKRWVDAGSSLSTYIDEHDAHGRPQVIRDANGIKTRLEYHPRGWLKTRIADYQGVSPQTTTLTYDAIGQLDRVTLPTGAYLDYDYDAAHRLIRVKDNLNNKIEYTLNLMSQRTAEKVYDSAGTLRRQSTAVFNTLSQLEQSITGTGNITRHTYDANGNRKRTIDPRDPAPATPTIFMENLYDALDRVRDEKDNINGHTTLTYDVFDQPKTVTDPRGVVTTYTYNGFGEMTQQVSPDSGTTTYQYDNAGNRTQQTDARGVITQYQYDGLNRLTRIDYPTDTDTVMVYDEIATGGPGAKGRLTTMTDESGTTRLQYDARGNLTRKEVTTGGVTYVLQFGYNGADQLTSTTYPSGMIVTYTRDIAGLVTGVSSMTNVATNLLAGIAYEPFGPMKSGTLGNGIVETRSFDLAGRLGSTVAPSKQNQTFGYDPADNLTSITDTLRAVQGGTFGYDTLNRLTTQTSAASNRTFGYDPTGNRISMQQTSAPISTIAFTIAPTSNRVSQRAGVLVSYDAAGNQIGDPETNAIYSYSQASRTRTASIAGTLVSTRYYNGMGQRVVKDTIPYDNRVTRYFYNEDGQLLGEAVTQAGSLLHYREYVWLDERPVAQFTNVKTAGVWTSSTIDYLHTNQLERPLFMTDAAGTEVYRWQPVDAFGVGTHNTDVDGNGQPRDLRLGFPGQYYDAEIDGWYNYFRDYNARWGRYTQVDPIGLEGGVNPYLYANANPLRFVDPEGLTALPYPAIAAACAANPVICAITGSAALFCALHPDLCRVDRCLPDSPPAPPFYDNPLSDNNSDSSRYHIRPPGAWPADSGSREWDRLNKSGRKGRDKFHEIKQNSPWPGGREDWSVDPVTGDIYDPNGDPYDNLND